MARSNTLLTQWVVVVQQWWYYSIVSVLCLLQSNYYSHKPFRLLLFSVGATGYWCGHIEIVSNWLWGNLDLSLHKMVPNVTGFFLHKRMEQRENSGQQEQQLEGISVLLAFVIGRQWLHCTVCYHHITINFPLPSFKKGYIISIFSHLEPQRMSLSSPPLQPTQSIHLSHNVSLFFAFNLYNTLFFQ